MTYTDFIDKDYFYALVGASKDKEKFGNIVFLDLHNSGFDVVPINDHESVIEGEEAFATISDVERNIDVVVFVIPPDAVLPVLAEVRDLAIPMVWFQPGSESEAAEKFCEENRIKFMSGSCIMKMREQ